MTLPVPEDHLIARCRSGDVDAFAELYAQHQAPIYRFAYRMTGSHEDAADLRQETFIRAWQAVPRFRGECDVRGWLLRICANLCRTHLSSRRRTTEVMRDVDPSLAAPPDADPAVRAAREADGHQVRAALAALPASQRELIVLREYEELSCEEIARIFGCAAGTVRVKLFRARARLRKLLEAHWASDDPE
jgi:RNA polymerase sigma-70 factor (ECF subfamily)